MGGSSTSGSATSSRSPRWWRLWFGFLGGALAWGLHFGGLYTLVSVHCATGWLSNAPAWLIGIGVVVTLLALGITGAAGWAATQLRRDTPATGDAVAEARLEAGRALGTGGMLLNGLFALLIALETLPLFVLRACG